MVGRQHTITFIMMWRLGQAGRPSVGGAWGRGCQARDTSAECTAQGLCGRNRKCFPAFEQLALSEGPEQTPQTPVCLSEQWCDCPSSGDRGVGAGG